MQKKWILVADSSRARVFEADEQLVLSEVAHFDHPEGQAQNRELVTDAHGRYFGRGERYEGHIAEPAVTATQHEQQLFSRTVTGFVNQAVLQHEYETLWLVAPPAFLGLLRSDLHKEAQKRVQREIGKDISRLKPHEVADYLRQQLE